MERLAKLYKERADAGDPFAAHCYRFCQQPHLRSITSTNKAAAALHDAIVEFEERQDALLLAQAILHEEDADELFEMGAKCYMDARRNGTW